MLSKGKILHLFGWDKKFAPPFIGFVRDHFAMEEHRFIVYGAVREGDLPQDSGIVHYPHLLKNLLPLMAEMWMARKIIIHGLFSSHLLYTLMLQSWLLKKCYWTIWGGDLYVHDTEKKDWRWCKNEWIRRFVVSRLGHLVTQVRGDYELAQQWYGASGQWHECFMYPSNLYHDYLIESSPHEGIRILLGNSATPTNNHLDALEKMRPFADRNIRIYCPLSYGDASYGDWVAQAGQEIFGENFIPLRELMPFEKYLELLVNIDVAVFNHDRQQGMGSITTLLGLGKTIYMRNNLTSFCFLKNKGFVIRDIESIADIRQLISKEDVQKNREIAIGYFSEKVLCKALMDIFI